VEEVPTEIFVWQEMPFDLELVGSLLSDICNSLRQCIACGSVKAHPPVLQPQGQLPDLKIAEMDDITSCLTLLRNYITSWSHELSSRADKLVDDVHLTATYKFEECSYNMNRSGMAGVHDYYFMLEVIVTKVFCIPQGLVLSLASGLRMCYCSWSSDR